MTTRLLVGDCREVLATLPEQSVQCCVSSPPYFGLRAYLPDGHPDKAHEIGTEPTPDAYVAELVAVFRGVRRVLADDGVVFLNLGDSYAGASATGEPRVGIVPGEGGKLQGRNRNGVGAVPTLKPKDLIGIPWRVAFALQADGWYLRADIIWCLSGGAWVYARTQKGDMPVMVKDLVRLNPTTVQLWNGKKWTRVLGWGRSTDESERIELVLRSGERIGCTGGHLWPTQRGNVAARELSVGDRIATCVLPEPDGCARPAYLTDDALWLAGLFLAEGSRSDDCMQLALSADEAHWLSRIDAVARHYGGSSTSTLSGGNLSVRMYGRVLDAILRSFVAGNVAVDKHIRAEVWRLPNSALRLLAQGYLDGDAHHDEPNGRYRLGFCRNYSLERDLRTLAARLGATLTLNPSQVAYNGEMKPSFRGEWRWERSGHHNERDRGEVVEIRASRARQFWDIAVEDEPHLFALASGVLTHNCKPNPMPESVRDRPTKAHEYVFLLSKQERYFYDAAAIAEEVQHPTVTHKSSKASTGADEAFFGNRPTNLGRCGTSVDGTRNARSVWTITPKPFRGAHFATFPPALAERCIKAGSRPGDTVLDPFAGAGTTLMVAAQLQRNAVGVELNPAYAAMAEARIAEAVGMLAA